MTSWTK